MPFQYPPSKSVRFCNKIFRSEKREKEMFCTPKSILFKDKIFTSTPTPKNDKDATSQEDGFDKTDDIPLATLHGR